MNPVYEAMLEYNEEMKKIREDKLLPDSIWETPKKYKKYIVFYFEQYYPSGGLNDIVGSYETLQDAENSLNRGDITYGTHQIVERDTWEIVKEFPKEID